MTYRSHTIKPPGLGGVSRPIVEVILDRPPDAAWYGVHPGCDDAAEKLQRACDAQRALFLQPGCYQFTKGVKPQPCGVLIGSGMLQTRIQRVGVWPEDTFTFGSPDLSTSAGNCMVSDMLMEQLHPDFVIGQSSTMTDQLTGNQSHISCYGGAHPRFERLWFQHGPYGLSVAGSVQVFISDIHSVGSWDNKAPAVSEQLAAIRLTQNQSISALRFNTEVRIEHTYVGGGGPSAPRQITVGDQTYIDYENIGSAHGILVEACEGLSIRSGYVGGCGLSGISFWPHGLISEVSIDDMFLDEMFGAQIRFFAGNQAVNGVNIGSSMRCNGQLKARHAIQSDFNPNIPGNFSVMDLNVTGGNYRNYLECGMLLLGVGTGYISNANIRAYNAKGGNGNRIDIASSIYVDHASRFVMVDGGIHGGGVNNSPGNYAKWGPVFAQPYHGQSGSVRTLLGQAGGTAVGGWPSQTYPA